MLYWLGEERQVAGELVLNRSQPFEQHLHFQLQSSLMQPRLIRVVYSLLMTGESFGNYALTSVAVMKHQDNYKDMSSKLDELI